MLEHDLAGFREVYKDPASIHHSAYRSVRRSSSTSQFIARLDPQLIARPVLRFVYYSIHRPTHCSIHRSIHRLIRCSNNRSVHLLVALGPLSLSLSPSRSQNCVTLITLNFLFQLSPSISVEMF